MNKMIVQRASMHIASLLDKNTHSTVLFQQYNII